MGSSGKRPRVPPPPPPPPPEPTRQPDDQVRKQNEDRKFRFSKRRGRSESILSGFGSLGEPKGIRKTLLGG